MPVVGGGAGTTRGLRARLAHGRPNWWVILAVSLALMALLVSTSGGHHSPSGRAAPTATTSAPVAAQPKARPRSATGPSAHRPATGSTTTSTTTTTTTATPGAGVRAGTSGPSLLSSVSSGSSATGSAGTTTTTTTQPDASTGASGAVPAVRTQAQGYLDPPLNTSNVFVFTGSGTTEISVLWSGGAYLTMDVSCASGGQSVGGTDAMAATLPGATGDCTATVGEPSSETATVTYTITIGPTGA